MSKKVTNLCFKRRLIFYFTATLFTAAFAQDPQFSQFYASPVNLNPALTGGFAAKYRVSAIYRDQWRGPLEQSIGIFGAALDLRFDLQSRAWEGDAAAVGLQFLSDQVGPLDLSTNTIALAGAFHKSLDQDHSKYLSAGIQLATTQRNLLYENLFFQDQFDGVDRFSGATGEDLPDNNFSFSDFAMSHWNPYRLSQSNLRSSNSNIGVSGSRYFVVPIILFTWVLNENELGSGYMVFQKIINL